MTANTEPDTDLSIFKLSFDDERRDIAARLIDFSTVEIGVGERVYLVELPEGISTLDEMIIVVRENELFFMSRYTTNAILVGERSIVVPLYRNDADDDDVWRIDGIPSARGVLVSYESGIIFLDNDLRIKWHIERKNWGYFSRIDSAFAYFTLGDEEISRVDLETGAELDV